MTIKTEKKEITGIVNRLLDNLAMSTSSVVSSALSFQIGELRTNYLLYLANRTFLSKLLDCFTTARTTGCSLQSLVVVHEGLFAEVPVGDISNAIVVSAVVFCLAAESRIISLIDFTSRDDIDVMMKSTKDVFETAKELAADRNDSSTYQAIIFLAGALTNYLANESRPLPRMVDFELKTSYAALSLSNLIYYSAERWEEVVLENKVINPAFCPRSIRGLSA